MAVALITCSGLSNVGRLTTAVGQQLLMRRPGRTEWVRAQAGPEAIADAADGADFVIALDGCEDSCGSRKAAEAGIKPAVRIMAIDLGIVKDGRAEVMYSEIEMVIHTVLEAVDGI
ncbi:MAG: zinc-binding protein [Methanospirillum sp.]|nr:zinc-binding protein [Methanospirillum sp.]